MLSPIDPKPNNPGEPRTAASGLGENQKGNLINPFESPCCLITLFWQYLAHPSRAVGNAHTGLTAWAHRCRLRVGDLTGLELWPGPTGDTEIADVAQTSRALVGERAFADGGDAVDIEGWFERQGEMITCAADRG